MKKPSSKSIEIITGVMEESLKQKSVGLQTTGDLVSILFPSFTKVPKDMYDLREELGQRGFLMFYSHLSVKKEEVFSINICKI